MSQTDDLSGFISIKRIKELSFSLFERGYVDDPSRVVRIELALTLGHIIERSLVQLTIRIYYHYQDSPNPPYLVDTVVQTIFEVAELKKYVVKDDEIKLPQDVIILLTDLTVSHGRAFLAKNLQGTVWQENIIGVVNPINLARFYFAPMFEDEPVSNLAKNEKTNESTRGNQKRRSKKTVK